MNIYDSAKVSEGSEEYGRENLNNLREYLNHKETVDRNNGS